MKTSTADTAAFTQIDLPRAGATLLRVALGIMFIAHSVVLKYVTYTLAGTAEYFVSIGLPAFLASPAASFITGAALEVAGGVSRFA